MKIRLTEGQYKRILTEDTNLKATKPILKVFELLQRKSNKYGRYKVGDLLKVISEYLGTTEEESYIIYKNFVDYGLEWEENEPLEYYEMPVYTIRTIMPTVVTTRTYLPGFVMVKAASEENALNKALDGEYMNMYLDENSIEYDNPDLDYDLYADADIMEDMVIDHIDDVDWSDPEEIEDRIKIFKK
jgi:hypothetical protein